MGDDSGRFNSSRNGLELEIVMGMYTEILVKASVDLDSISQKNMSVIKYLFSDGEEPREDALPDHKFFTLPRWSLIGHCSSYYHHPVVINSMDEYGSIFSRSDIKNYDGEIEAFFDWFQPLATKTEGECIGYYWYEECELPTLVVKE